MQPAGAYRQRVSIRRDVEADDSHGGFTTTPTITRARIAASVAALTGRDLERARAIDPRAAFLVGLRYWTDHLDDLKGGRFQIVWHDGATDRVLEVVEPPREVEHRVRLEFACREAS